MKETYDSEAPMRREALAHREAAEQAASEVCQGYCSRRPVPATGGKILTCNLLAMPLLRAAAAVVAPLHCRREV